MTDTIVVAIISFGGTLIGTFGGIIASQQLTAYRIKALEAKVEKHNNVIERVFRLEDTDRLLEEKIQSNRERISDLERERGKKS